MATQLTKFKGIKGPQEKTKKYERNNRCIK